MISKAIQPRFSRRLTLLPIRRLGLALRLWHVALFTCNILRPAFVTSNASMEQMHGSFETPSADQRVVEAGELEAIITLHPRLVESPSISMNVRRGSWKALAGTTLCCNFASTDQHSRKLMDSKREGLVKRIKQKHKKKPKKMTGNEADIRKTHPQQPVAIGVPRTAGRISYMPPKISTHSVSRFRRKYGHVVGRYGAAQSAGSQPGLSGNQHASGPPENMKDAVQKMDKPGLAQEASERLQTICHKGNERKSARGSDLSKLHARSQDGGDQQKFGRVKPIHFTPLRKIANVSSDHFGILNKIRNDIVRKWPGVLTEPLHVTPPGWEAAVEAFFAKAVPGGRLRIVAVGGSILAGGGGVGPGASFVEVLAEILRKIFPETTVEVVNGARGATGSATTSFCLYELLGEQADLVLTEFALNDYPWYGKSSDPFEHLLRRIAVEFPGALVINVLFYGVDFDFGPETGALHKKFAELSIYYYMAAFSVRRMTEHLMNPRKPAGGTKENKTSILADESHHPKRFFHQLIGQMLLLLLGAASGMPNTGNQRAIGSDACNDNSTAACTLPLPTSKSVWMLDYDPGSRPNCSITGLPQVSGVWKLNSLIENPPSWTYVNRPGDDKRRDQIAWLTPSSGIRQTPRPLLLRVRSQSGNYPLVLGEAQQAPTEYKRLWPRNQTITDLVGQPFRAFDACTGQELMLAKVFCGSTELWVSQERLAEGEHVIRLSPNPSYSPYVSLASVIA